MRISLSAPAIRSLRIAVDSNLPHSLVEGPLRMLAFQARTREAFVERQPGFDLIDSLGRFFWQTAFPRRRILELVTPTRQGFTWIEE